MTGALFISYGCGGAPEKASNPSGSFKLVSIEEGGRCRTPAPCWKRLTVTSAAQFISETPEARVEKNLSTSEFAEVSKIANSSSFRSVVGAPEPRCPTAFGLQVIFVLETSEITLRDPHGQGCISDEFTDHPYRNLRTLLNRLADKYFPAP